MRILIIVPIAIVFFLASTACTDEKNPFNVKSEKFLEADSVAAMVFAPDGRLFYGEQLSGNIRVVSADGQLQTAPFAHIDVAVYLEWGLTGLALDPDFTDNSYLYAYYTEKVRDETIPITPAPASPGSSPALPTTVTAPIGRPVIIRYTDQNNTGTNPKVIVGDLPETTAPHPGYDANGNIAFGPDGYLYFSIGDYDTSTLVQDLSTPVGKLLRVDKETGEAAPGNPFIDDPAADPRIFAYGFREPFDFIFHPKTKAVYQTDNTPVTCEELNIVKAGKNYDWPDVGMFPFDKCDAGSHEKAIYHFAKEGRMPGDFLSFVEISSLEFVSGSVYPTIGDALLVCEGGTGLLRRLTLTGDQVTANDVVVKDCKLEIALGPGGIVYYSDANAIKKLVPQAPE